MLDLIQKFFPKKNKTKIIDTHPDHEQCQIAAAVLLLEAAQIDNECTSEELDHVIETLKANFKISDETAKNLLELAHDKKSEAVDLWEFTNYINNTYSIKKKIVVMEEVWRIIYVDGHLDEHEDYFAHRLANLLRLSHREMIEAKLAAKKQMEV